LSGFFLFVYLFSQMWQVYIKAQPPVIEGMRYELTKVGADRYVAQDRGVVFVVNADCTGQGEAVDHVSTLVFRNDTCEIRDRQEDTK
jgi:hypothetical protein